RCYDVADPLERLNFPCVFIVSRYGSREGESGNGLEPDNILVERCLAGDQAAWAELVRTHTRRIYNLCYRFTGRSQEAEDLTQDVFLRVYKTVGSFQGSQGSFTTWLT